MKKADDKFFRNCYANVFNWNVEKWAVCTTTTSDITKRSRCGFWLFL